MRRRDFLAGASAAAIARAMPPALPASSVTTFAEPALLVDAAPVAFDVDYAERLSRALGIPSRRLLGGSKTDSFEGVSRTDGFG